MRKAGHNRCCVFFCTHDQRLHQAADVTCLRAAFYPAESYHQEYFDRNPGQPYCMFVVAPKVAKFRKAFAERLRRR